MAKEIIPADLGGEALSPEELAAIPEFQTIRKEVWARFPGAIARKIYEPGEIIVTEGDFGTTAFYLLSGEAEIFLQSRIAGLETHKRPKRKWFQSLTKVSSLVRGKAAQEQVTKFDRTHIPMDSSVDLPIENPTAVLGAGELFGELCALAAFKQEKVKRPKFYPRSATVRAKTRVTALEMLPNILNNVLYSSPAFRGKLNENYRSRALDNHLRSVSVFQHLNTDFMDYLRQRVELVHCAPGEVICRQGEVADCFYLIRLGFVKVSQHFPGGEMVLTYLSRGSYFGEMGLLPPVFRIVAKSGGHEASSAVSRTPLTVGCAVSSEPQLSIPWESHLGANHFRVAVEGSRVRVSRLPGTKSPLIYRMQPFETFLIQPGESFVVGDTTFELRADQMGTGYRTATCTAIDFVQLVRISAADFGKMLDLNPSVELAIQEVAHDRWEMDRQTLSRVQQIPLNTFLEQELMQAQNLLLIDLDKCTRCDECVKACAATHEDGITRLIRDGLRFDHYLVPTTCRACMDPLCMTRCPVGSIRRKSTLDIVIEDWCIGCGNCSTDCPYGNINVVALPDGNRRAGMTPKLPKATVCDLCVEYDEPNCVRACPHDAAIRVEPKAFFAPELAGIQLRSGLQALLPVSPITLATVDTPNVDTSNDVWLASPLLKVISGPTAGRFLKLRRTETTFGRAGGLHYSFPEAADLSRLHCRIVVETGSLRIIDNSSTNGTFVNGNLVESMPLRMGDVIEIGAIQMEVTATDS